MNKVLNVPQYWTKYGKSSFIFWSLGRNKHSRTHIYIYTRTHKKCLFVLQFFKFFNSSRVWSGHNEKVFAILKDCRQQSKYSLRPHRKSIINLYLLWASMTNINALRPNKSHIQRHAQLASWFQMMHIWNFWHLTY